MTLRPALLIFVFALLVPCQALASSCYWPEATRLQLETPAGVAEFRAASSVAVVGLEPRLQPPCLWIMAARLVVPKAYARDVCEPTGRSQRYRATVRERLKGDMPARFDANFVGPHPIGTAWLAKRRPEVMWTRPSVWQRNREFGEPREVRPPGHSAFPFLHRGRIGDHGVVLKGYVCGATTAPMITTYFGGMSYIVFRNAGGQITHWEPVLRDGEDVLIGRLRRLRAGETDARDKISARDFFRNLKIVSRYSVKWCTDSSSRIRPANGEREQPIERIVEGHFIHNRSDAECRAGQEYLVVGAGVPSGDYFEERAWPSVQLLPVSNGSIRTADIVSQFKIVGPETIPVSQALAWTD